METATCINTFYYTRFLTFAKTYPVQRIHSEQNLILVKCDDQRTRWLPTFCFNLLGSNSLNVSSIWIECENWVLGQPNDNRNQSDVLVTLSNGSQWLATFYKIDNVTYHLFNSPHLNHEAKIFFYTKDIVLVNEITRSKIEAIVDHFLSTGNFDQVFTKYDLEEHYEPV